MGGRITAVILAAVLVAGAVKLADAHPISVSRASVYLTRTGATAQIEIFLEDLYLFHALKTNREDYLEFETIQRGIELHRAFLRQRFEIADVEGNRIEPTSVVVVDAQLPDRGVPLAELMAHQLVFELRYEFPAVPDVLNFSQRFTDEKSVLPSEMTLQIKQENAGAPIEHTLLACEPYSLRINWDNPPLAPEASQREREQWASRQKKTLLGITRQSSVYSFLYVEDFEVRHEVLAPLLSLSDDLGISSEQNAVLDVSRQDAIREQIGSYFASGNPILIDGKAQHPVIQRCDFYALDTTDFAKLPQQRPLPLAGARVGVIMRYHLDRPPNSLQMTWDRFNDKVWGVTAVVIAGDDIARQKLTRVGNRNTVHWQRTDKAAEGPALQGVVVNHSAAQPTSVPWLACIFAMGCAIFGVRAAASRQFRYALAAAGLLVAATATWPAPRCQWRWSAAPVLTDRDAQDVFRQLQANLYRSFADRREESIYDALALSVDGDLLRDIYLEVRGSLEMEDQGGAQARIGNVELLKTHRIASPLADADSFGLHCQWNVSGTVEHWGHVHERTNQYEAKFAVSPVDGYWKLTTMELLDQQRIGSETSLR